MLIYIVIVDSLFVDNTFLRWMHNDKIYKKISGYCRHAVHGVGGYG